MTLRGVVAYQVDALVAAMEAVGEWFSGAAALLAFVAFLVEFVRGRSETRSFRPLIGWITALLGGVAVAVAVVALRGRGVTVLSSDGLPLGIALMLGLVLFVVGVATAVLTPSADRPVLRDIAAAVEAAVRRTQVDSGFVPSNHVPLPLDVSDGLAWLSRGRTSTVRELSTSGMATASVAVVAGVPGSGKSVALWQFAADACRRVRQQRRPRELVVYVSVQMLPRISGPIDQDLVRDHLERSVSEGNSALGSKLMAYLDSPGGPRWVFVFDLDAELTREQEVAYFEALRNFMRHRDRDRALVAVRDQFPDARPVFTVRPPDHQRTRVLLEKQGLTVTAQADPELAGLLATPEMIMKFGDGSSVGLMNEHGAGGPSCRQSPASSSWSVSPSRKRRCPDSTHSCWCLNANESARYDTIAPGGSSTSTSSSGPPAAGEIARRW